MKRIISKILMVVLVVSGITVSSCEKDKDNDAPALPPESAFVIDFSDFQNNQKSTLTKANWATAAVTVGVWNTVLAVTLAVPVATYIQAIQQPAIRIDNDSWKWSFSVTVASVVYTAVLYADVAGTEVTWKMYVSQQGGFSDFLWFKGTCDILRTHGTWTLYHSPLNNVEFINIEWTHNYENNTGDIKYSNVVAGTDGYGDYIHYGVTTDTPYNVFYDLYDKSENKIVEINYNSVTKAGSIYYNDLWHCWDSNLDDITCPSR
ncbi:MAG: hypothetical protein JW973_10715 [Bacteroidales bacterium]|nr:hypothetical protein [Bacteroidales bacterium]